MLRSVIYALIGVTAIVSAVYLFSMRSGRYQIAGLRTDYAFVVLDTATGLFWVYNRDSTSEPFKLFQTEAPVAFPYRVLPPQWLDRLSENPDAGERIPGTSWRILPPQASGR